MGPAEAGTHDWARGAYRPQPGCRPPGMINCAPVPSAFITKMPDGFRSEANAMLVPSGDQEGSKSFFALLVRRVSELMTLGSNEKIS